MNWNLILDWSSIESSIVTTWQDDKVTTWQGDNVKLWKQWERENVKPWKPWKRESVKSYINGPSKHGMSVWAQDPFVLNNKHTSCIVNELINVYILMNLSALSIKSNMKTQKDDNMKTWKHENMKAWKRENMKTWKHENMKSYMNARSKPGMSVWAQDPFVLRLIMDNKHTHDLYSKK